MTKMHYTYSTKPALGVSIQSAVKRALISDQAALSGIKLSVYRAHLIAGSKRRARLLKKR